MNDSPATPPEQPPAPPTDDEPGAALPLTPRPRRRSRRIRPLIAAVTLLALAAAAALIRVAHREAEVERNVFARIMEQQLDETQTEFRQLLQPFSRVLATLDAWQGAGLLEATAPPELRTLIAPLVAPTPQIELVCVVPVEPTGTPATVLIRDGDDWRSESGAELTAACRQAAWFVEATADSLGRQPLWSDYTALPVSGASGLVAARRSGPLVLAAGLLESTLDGFAAAAPITENGILVRLYDTGHLAWLTPRYGNRLTVSTFNELFKQDLPEHRTIGAALSAWSERGNPYRRTFRFRHDGRTWWCMFYPAEAGTDPGELGLIAPAGDLQRRLESANDQVTALLVGIVALAALAVVLLAFDYRAKWQRIARRRRPAPETPEQLQSLLAGGESRHLEFKQTMRWNLHAGKPGKEIELAWLKSVVAFLNTDGGHVALGVADDGAVTGLAPDGFKNDDMLLQHFDNLINQHVGLGQARCIHPALFDLDGRQVLLVTCDASDEPAFLTVGAKEDFYIRIGASSRVLPASRIIDYQRERQA